MANVLSAIIIMALGFGAGWTARGADLGMKGGCLDLGVTKVCTGKNPRGW